MVGWHGTNWGGCRRSMVASSLLSFVVVDKNMGLEFIGFYWSLIARGIKR